MPNRTKRIALALGAAVCALSTPATAQQADRTRELYHIFDIQTEASRADLVKAVKDGMNINVSDSQTITPLVRGTPPEEPGSFELVDPLADGRLGGLGALIGAAQAAQIKQVKCDGAVWIATAQRRIRGSQTLRLTLCLFPYANDDARGYHLDAYALDTEEKGGGLSKRLGRLIAGAIVGNPEDWTNKTIVDLLREVHRQTDAKVDYVEGQPAFTERPWENDWQLMPSVDEQTEDR